MKLLNSKALRGLVLFCLFCLVAQSAQALTLNEIVNYKTTGKVLGGATFAVQVVGTTNTQAVLAYTAPDTGPCTVKVSENSSLTPPVHDVDPVLFSGSDQDNRSEAISSGTNRVFVAGKRLTEKALDGNNYSRALQAYTTHYYQITCGSDVATGSFNTANIPLGMTYNDVPQPDYSNPGQWMIPTELQDRTQTIVDPQTGALLKRVSLDAEHLKIQVSQGIYLSDGGFVRNCGKKLQSAPDGAQGYLCFFYHYNDERSELYFIVPATGEVRDLGMMNVVHASIDDNMNVYSGDGSGNTYRYTYTGNFVPHSGAPFSAGVLYSSVPVGQLMKEFDPSFDDTLFGCGGASASAGSYSVIVCRRGIQDSYGWLGVLYGGDGRAIVPNCTAGNACPRVVAAMNVAAAPATRWCALHSIESVPDNPLASINFQILSNFSPNWESGYFGTAPMLTTLSSDIGAGQASITVDNEPKSLDATDTFRQNAAVGDIFYIGQNKDDTITITGITTQADGKRVWQVTHSAQKAFTAGTQVWAGCKAGFNFTYWKYLNDPHGSDTTNTNVVIDHYWNGGGHQDNGILGRVTEDGPGWSAVFGKIIDNLDKPLSLTISDSPLFAGKQGLDYGSTTSKHPSYHQDENQTAGVEQKWFMDMMPFDGGNLISNNPGATLVSGQLYQYHAASTLARKQLATIASTGGTALVDISGVGSSISTGAGDSYKYCIANIAGECRGGSSAGDIFINAPNVKYIYCTGGDGPNPANLDLCLANIGTWAQGMVQIYLGTSSADSTSHSRTITHGLAGVKDMFYYSTAKSLPNASWALFGTGILSKGDIVNVWMAKLPPLVAQDSVDRGTFVSAPINITVPQGQGIAEAAVEFGYAEQGTQSQHYCTSRREPCIASSAGVTDSNPFSFEQTDSYTKMPCTASCTIALPVLPMHAAYYQVKYYKAGGTPVANGDQGVAMESAVADINNLSAPTDITPPVISAIAGSAINTTSAAISWTTDEVSDSQVEYGTTSAYGQTTVLNTGLVTSHIAGLSGLTPSTVYHYRVKSRDAASNLSVSADQTLLTTGIADTQAPTVPTDLSATPVSASEIDLSWTGSTDNIGVAGYHVSSGGIVIATTTQTSFQNTGLPAGTGFVYAVSAFDADGNESAYSPSVSASSQSSGGSGSSGGGGGTSGGGGGGTYIPPLIVASSTLGSTLPTGLPATSSGITALRLINLSGTYYLILNNVRHGITNPGLLNSYGFSLSDAKTATANDISLAEGGLLLPYEGSLVKSPKDPTVYLISQGQRHGFTSAPVFTGLGFKFNSVLLVTDPELQALPKAQSPINNSKAPHLPGVDISYQGTVYWVGGASQKHPYPSQSVYNSWHIKNNFTTVVPANAADLTLTVGDIVGQRIVN